MQPYFRDKVDMRLVACFGLSAGSVMGLKMLYPILKGLCLRDGWFH